MNKTNFAALMFVAGFSASALAGWTFPPPIGGPQPTVPPPTQNIENLIPVSATSGLARYKAPVDTVYGVDRIAVEPGGGLGKDPGTTTQSEQILTVRVSEADGSGEMLVDGQWIPLEVLALDDQRLSGAEVLKEPGHITDIKPLSPTTGFDKTADVGTHYDKGGLVSPAIGTSMEPALVHQAQYYSYGAGYYADPYCDPYLGVPGQSYVYAVPPAVTYAQPPVVYSQPPVIYGVPRRRRVIVAPYAVAPPVRGYRVYHYRRRW
ncbi:MAG: hypothetical protein AB7F86_10300 [Bdellovibrionales bacterium]